MSDTKAKRLYVGNLSFKCTDDDLRELFEKYGKVESARVLINRETNRSRGFGFVEMENDNEGDAAIEALNKKEYMGRALTVNEARSREEKTGGGGNGGYRDGGFKSRKSYKE